MSLDWRTEEEVDHPHRPTGMNVAAEESAGIPRFGPAGNPWRRRLLLPIIAVALLAALGSLVFRQVEGRAEAGRRRVEAEVLASHATVVRAVAEGDLELFNGFLSGRDPEWGRSQEALVQSRIYLDRANFGLSLAADSSPITPTVILNTDLRAAEVAAPRRYTAINSEGMAETVVLTQTTVFRQGPDRWLLAPPGPDFWGDVNTIARQHLLLRYPARDRAIVERLSRDLDGVLRELCAELSGGCARLSVTFTTDPAALVAYQKPLERLRGGEAITLPSPTLIGEPADDAAYQALYREYATRVTAAAMANYAGWACCEDALFYVELAEAQLHALGLRPWPRAPINFERLVEAPSGISRLWGSATVAPSHADIWPVHGLVDFLLQSTDHLPIPEMQRLLLSDTNPSFHDWLNRVTNADYASPGEFERDFIRYAAANRLAATPPIPLPWQDLQLVCRTGDEQPAALFRYDLVSGLLRRELDFEVGDAPIITALPGRDGVAVASGQASRPAWGPFIWRDGQAVDLALKTADPLRLIPLPPTPYGSTQLFAAFSPFGTWPLYAELAADGCANRRPCVVEPLAGVPLWSPDRKYRLLSVGESMPLWPDRREPILYLGDDDDEALTLIGPGSSPFWLDEDTFGYIASRPDLSGQAVFLRDVVDASSASGGVLSSGRVANAAAQNVATGSSPGALPAGPAISNADALLTTIDLENMPFLSPVSEKFIDRVLPSPDGSALYIITANPLNQGRVSYVIEYDLTSGGMTGRFSFDGEASNHPRLYRFSPDGRWLVVGILRQPSPVDRESVWQLHLHGIGEPATRGLTRIQELTIDDPRQMEWRIDWSSDGQWLAMTTNNYVRLLAPNEDYVLPLVFDDLACSAAVWVNER